MEIFLGIDPLDVEVGRARHPGPCTPYYPSGFSIEFLNVGGWLSRGDLASLNTVLSLLGLATLPLSFVKLVVLRFGHPLVRTSLLVAMQG